MKRRKSRKRTTPAQAAARRKFVARFANKPKRKRRTRRARVRRIARVPVMAKTRRRRRTRRRSSTPRVARRRRRYSAAPKVRRRRRRGGSLLGGSFKLIPNKGMIMSIGAGVAGGAIAAYGSRKLVGWLSPSQAWANTPAGQAGLGVLASLIGGYVVGKLTRNSKLGASVALGGAVTSLFPVVASRVPGLAGAFDTGGVANFAGAYGPPMLAVSNGGAANLNGSPVGNMMANGGMDGVGCGCNATTMPLIREL